MGLKPKIIELRNKTDADEFLLYEIEQGDEFAKKFFLPEELSGETVKVELILGKRKRKIYLVSTIPEGNKEVKFL